MARAAGGKLDEFLKERRASSGYAQKVVADALGISQGLLSSWENGSATPGDERLRSVARFYATPRSVVDGKGQLIALADLTQVEDRAYQELVSHMFELRDRQDAPAGEESRRPSFWEFRDDQSVTVLCTPLSSDQFWGTRIDREVSAALAPALQYALNPTHPNHIRNFANGDIDPLVEIVGNLRALNPSSEVRWMTYDRRPTSEDLTGHVVLLGGGDFLSRFPVERSIVFDIAGSLELPVWVEWEAGGDDEFDAQFVVTRDAEGRPDRDGTEQDVYRPRFRRDESDPARPRLLERGAPLLQHDVALIARGPNPLNGSATLTMCSGLFSRGTYGAVRAFTDPTLRERNEAAVADLVDSREFWLLMQVPVLNGETTVTPDLGSRLVRLRDSSERVA